MSTSRLAAAVILSCLIAQSLFAGQSGSSERSPRFERGTVEVSIVGGSSLPITMFRADADEKLTSASVQIGRVMAGRSGGNNLQLIIDAAPFLQVRQPGLVWGWSVSPLFVRWNFPPIGGNGPRVYGEFSGGLLFTREPVPVRTTTFNFLDQAGFGLRMHETPKRAWLLGYRFQHVSNAGRVKPNPGANFNFVYFGVSFMR